MKANSRAVKSSRARAGVVSTSFSFTAGEKAEIDSCAARLGLSRTEAVLTCVRASNVGASNLGVVSNGELFALLRARLSD